ncbi:hypothetical protein IJO12_05620 [bacterium]|nr:hypothetical protein [bacterium]
MFRIIKIIFNAFILVLAIIGFNAIGGQKYVETAKTHITNFIQEKINENAKSLGDFSLLHEEFHIDNMVNILGYKALIAEHNASGQKMCILDTGKKKLLNQADIEGNNLEIKLNDLAKNFKYQAVSFNEIKVIEKGHLNAYGQNIAYARVEAKASKLPISDVVGIIASVKTSDNSEKIILAFNEKKKYSQLITEEFYKNVKE